MSNSNRQASQSNWQKYNSFSTDDFDDEYYSQSTLPLSSSNKDDDEDEETNRDVESDLNSDVSDDIEIPMLYGQIRQLIRGPAMHKPADVEYLPATTVPNAEEGKETLTPSTVVTSSPPIIGPVEVTTNQTDAVPHGANIEIAGKSESSEQRDAANAPVHEDVTKKSDDGSPPVQSVRSEAAKKAGMAACARAARKQPYKTQSETRDRNRLSMMISTQDVVIAAPCFISTSQSPELRDSLSDDSQSSSMEDAALVAARRTTPLYGRGTSPWLTEDRSNGRAAAATSAAAAAAESRLTSSTPHPSPSEHPRQQQQQQQQHAPVTAKRCHTVPQAPRPSAASRLRSQLGCLRTPAAGGGGGGNTSGDDLPLEPDVDQTERKTVVANADGAQSAPLRPPYFLSTSPPSRPPPPAAPLASCLKYHSATTAAAGASTSSTSSHDSQRRRRIRFATEVKKRTFV